MAALSRLYSCLLNGVQLEQPVELLLIAPAATKVVEPNLGRGRVDNDRIEPIGKLDDEPGNFAAEQRGGAVDRFGQAEPAARCSDRVTITDFCFDANNVRQGDPPLELVVIVLNCEPREAVSTRRLESLDP
jgi:hypothetical protein